MNGARVKLMELREYVSDRSGKTYFSGFLGKAKVVVLRDERAECTGREKARWNVLLEEPEPRDGDRPPRGDSRSPGRQRGLTAPDPTREARGAPQLKETAADRRASQVLREQGIDPDREMPRDEMPF
jgi:hypothetical protein